MPPSKWMLEKAVFGGFIELDVGLTTIGRNLHSTIVASSDYVSRNHAQINISPDSRQIRITDLGSKNGIYVNEYQYCNAECILNVGDRIGIGVEVEDDVVLNFPEGKYPIYILRHVPNEQPALPDPSAPIVEELAPQADPPPPIPEAIPPQVDPPDIITDSDKNNVEELPRPDVESPPIEIKQELDYQAVSTSRKICENIKSIFGDLNSEILDALPEETRKIAESSNHFREPVVCEDVICISSSEDEDCDLNEKRQLKVISPQLFNDSFNSDKDKPVDVPQNDAIADDQQNEPKPMENEPQQIEMSKPPEANTDHNQPPQTSNQTPPNEQFDSKSIKDEFEDEADDLWFTQQIFEDMKEDLLQNEENPDELKNEPEHPDTMVTIKEEVLSQNLDGTVINLDDDDDFDEDLENQTQKWTTRLSKQIFSNSFNASQVYEDTYSDEENNVTPTSRTIFIVDDDDDDELDFVDRVAMREVKIEPGIEVETRVEPCGSPSPEKIKPPKQNYKRLQKDLFSSSSGEEDQVDKPSTSVASLNKFHEKVVRRLSISEDIPQKKAKISHKSDEEDTGDKIQVRRTSSSSHKHYSRQSSGSKHSHSSTTNGDATSASAEDLFDKLKEEEKTKQKLKQKHDKKRRPSSTSSSNSHKHSHERKKSTDKSSHSRRGSSSVAATEQNGNSIYKSAKVARMQSIDARLSIDHNEEDCFVDVKKNNVESPTEECRQAPTLPKMIRGPPEIIQPPKLPVNKGKLRGISAVQNRISEALKASSEKNDLKRKWLEKPSKNRDKEKSKAIQETRKQKLKELNDKKQTENAKVAPNKTSNNETTAENGDKEANRKKLKVKVTQNNRGAFLTEPPPPTKTHYTIPKKTQKPNEGSSSSTTSNGGPAKTSPPKTPAPPKKPPEPRKPSTDVVNSFALELAQADTVVLQRQTSRDRLKSIDTTREQKQCAPPRANKKAVSFASMNQHYEETKRALAKMKKVTFKLPPEIRYIESNLSAKPKRFQRESSTFMERKTNIRGRYPILDKTDILLDDVLAWSQLWLNNKHHMVSMMTFPMRNNFKTFNEYKNNVLPLLKMEYLGFLEQSMEQSASKPRITADIDYSAPHKQRDYVFAKCNTNIRPSDLSFNDLALIEILLNSAKLECFGYVSNIRKGGTCSCITIEVVANTISKEILKTKPKITIRRIIDGIRMHLGTFNAVHQLEHTPIIDKILNPIELLNTDNNIRLPNIEYKGFNELNTEQREILLKTYEKAIDQLNPNVSLINGPPGTGKSVLISNLAVQLLYGNEVNELDKKILICAQSNMAVDVIAEKLIKIKQKLTPETSPFNVVRYGVEEKVHPNVRGITIKALLQRHRMNILRKQANQNDPQACGGEENLALEIVQLEARIAEMERQKFQDVRQEELIEMRKSLVLKKNIVNQMFRPEDERRLTKWFLENANVVCSTLSGCIKLAGFVDYFDICIIDEATQCTEPWTLMPLKFGVSNLVMVGDTQQLPATVISQSAKELGLEISLFTRIKKCLENNYIDATIPKDIKEMPIYTLNEQYRMHSEISKWPNMYFYKNQLRNNPKTDEFKSSIKPFSILNLEYRQNDTYFGQVSGQISNHLEAEFVAKLVTTLDNYIPNKFYSYGVITPYAHHREKLEKMIRNSGLKNIMVNTIDSYQGIEKDVIIISNARTHGVGFLGNYQRLNVALTRPRKCLILCGNFKNLESVPSWASLLANAKERGLYHNISANDALDITKNVIEKIKIVKR